MLQSFRHLYDPYLTLRLTRPDKTFDVTQPTFIQVAVPSPLRQTFDYLPPAGCDRKRLQPGTRIQIPFGNRRIVGMIVDCSTTTDVPKEKIRPAYKLLDESPLLDKNLVALYHWSADYYQYPLGQALQTSLPVQIRKGHPAIEHRPRMLRLTPAGMKLDPKTLKRAPRQLQLMRLLADNAPMTSAQLKAAFDIPLSACLKTLLDKGLVEEFLTEEEVPMTRAELYGEDAPLQLNREQQAALEAIRKVSGSFAAFLLEGITGSGKTEVYLQAIADCLGADRQVLVMVPEISLTPQAVRRFARRFNREIAVFHSGLNDGERFNAWLRARNGKADIIIGTRSAIFTPLARPGLIIVDEEHDASYKQQDGFRYSGRDLAIYRARQLGIPVILGTATPSLESLHNAVCGRYHFLQLTERAGNASNPDYIMLDLRGEIITEGFAESLFTMMSSHLNRRNQVLVFLNRRGFAPILLCRSCGWIAKCERCDTSYTLHHHPQSLSCHHCESSRPVPGACPECTGTELAAMGMGTEKTEQILKTLYPDIPVFRIDRDSTRNRGGLQSVLDKVDSGAPCILVGTQMLSKGHHFPNVTLVAVLDADAGLFSADFRGQEHMGQLLTQVAGRAGRGEAGGEVVIQTYNSTHPTLQSLVNDGYGPFARKLLKERRLGKLPPFTYMAVIRAEASKRQVPEKFLGDIRQATGNPTKGLNILGPMPAAMEKRGGLFRMLMIVEASKRSAVQHYLAHAIGLMEKHPQSRKVRWSVDVDPLDFI